VFEKKKKKRKIFNKRIKEDFKGLWISWPRKLKVTQVHQVFSLNNSWMQQTYSKHKNINTTGSCEDEIVLCFLHEWKDLEDKNICMRTFRNRKRMKNMGARNLRIKHPIYPPLKCRIIGSIEIAAAQCFHVINLKNAEHQNISVYRLSNLLIQFWLSISTMVDIEPGLFFV